MKEVLKLQLFLLLAWQLSACSRPNSDFYKTLDISSSYEVSSYQEKKLRGNKRLILKTSLDSSQRYILPYLGGKMIEKLQVSPNKKGVVDVQLLQELPITNQTALHIYKSRMSKEWNEASIDLVFARFKNCGNIELRLNRNTIFVWDKLITMLRSSSKQSYKKISIYFDEDVFDGSTEVAQEKFESTIGVLEGKRVETLLFNGIPIKNLPKIMPKGLSALYLEDSKFTKLPSGLTDKSHLKKLSLYFNNLTDIEGLSNLENLTELNLSSNEFLEIPQELFKLKNLELLFFGENELTSLPEEIGQLEHLIYLDLWYNKITTLPASFYQLKKLRAVNLSDNPIGSLSKAIGNLENLESLDLNGTGLKELPKELWQLEKLDYLTLGNNEIAEIPQGISNLKQLGYLNFIGSNLTVLPEEIGKLEKLHILSVVGNRLTSLPSTISGWKSIEELHVSSNQITSLPKEIGMLTNLKRLELSNNQLTSLPTELQNLKKLKYLSVKGNKIPEAEIEALTKALPDCDIRWDWVEN